MRLDCVAAAGHQSFYGVSDPDSGFASRVGYVGVVCGDQKYSNTVSEPTEYVLSLLSTSVFLKDFDQWSKNGFLLQKKWSKNLIFSFFK